MSTSKEYMQFVLDQLEEFPDVTYRKMFGEYMVYLQGRPVLLVCVSQLCNGQKAPRTGGADARRRTACPMEGPGSTPSSIWRTVSWCGR